MSGSVLLVVLIVLAIWFWLWRRARFAWVRSAGRSEERGPGGMVRTVHFRALDGTRLEAWLFQPDAVSAAH